mmetsp:Transcript_10015/g.34899  ORF Transcript_10015/g.34899 Transcript_10015/m.34899 type:complete len:815 (-) Transcript_10015:3046-5490(-)
MSSFIVNTFVELPCLDICTQLDRTWESKPTNIAIASLNGTLTYATFNSFVLHLQQSIVAHCCLHAEDVVGVLIDRQTWPIEYLSTLFAILFSRCAYTILSFGDPINHHKHVIEASKIQIICVPELACDMQIGNFAKLVQVLRYADFNKLESYELYVNNTAENDLKDCLAYICFTSGSTGRPKGVMVEHLPVNRLVLCTHLGPGAWRHFSDSTVILHHSNPTFDASVLEIYAPLLNGGTCIPFTASSLDFEIMHDCVSKFAVTDLWLTARVFDIIVDNAPSILAKLQSVITGGEQVSENHVQVAQTRFPCLKIFNGYGPTENCTFSTVYEYPISFRKGSGIIGKPISNTTCFVADENMLICEFNQVGELLVGGAGLGRGYIGMETLTAEKFIANPWGEGKLYKTGDLVKMLENYNLCYVGRIDDEIKRNGIRIDLPSLAGILESDDRISRACLLQAPNLQPVRIIAYIVACEQLRLSEKDCCEILLGHVNHSSLPDKIVFLSHLPLNGNGKVDKARLPNPFNTENTRIKVQAKSTHTKRNGHAVAEFIFKQLDQTTSPETELEQVCRTSIDRYLLRRALEKEYDISIRASDMAALHNIASLAEFVCAQSDVPQASTGSSEDKGEGVQDVYSVQCRYQTNDIKLRLCNPSDKDVLVQQIASDMNSGMKYMGAKYWLYNHFGQENLFSHKSNRVLLAIESVSSKELVGYAFIIFEPEQFNQVGWISQYISTTWQGTGVGADVFEMLLDFGFNQMNLRKLVSSVNSVGHQDSLRLWTHVGAHQEGCLRKETYINGQFHDRLIYGLFKSEWESWKQFKK